MKVPEPKNPAEESFEKRMEELYLPKPPPKIQRYIDMFFEPQTIEEFNDMIDFIVNPDASFINLMNDED
jgi:hypothetical protein